PALLRMPLQILRRVAMHEWELQRPTTLPDDGEPDQLMLEKEADERRAAMKGAEQGEDVDRGDMIADQEVVPRRPDVGSDPRDVPRRRQQPVEAPVVRPHP